ncbi:MAG: SIS domain-containing protein [Bacillota bacterium]|nr:SIS domain-containing protein [Bacillota bacterium]
MNALQSLLAESDLEKARSKGLAYTPREIAHQPEAWFKTAERVLEEAPLAGFLRQALEPAGPVILAGAGTSYYVGTSVRNFLTASWKRTVLAVPSTEIVLAPDLCLPRDATLMISYARSGQSPEGNAALELARQVRPETAHLAVTCNHEGLLYRLAGGWPGGFPLLLPEMTNDRGLAMTSSYSSMVVATYGLAFLNEPETYLSLVEKLAVTARRILDAEADAARQIAEMPFARALYVGNRDLFGVAQEAHLKLQEMSAGRVIGKAETTLGLRHGPMASIDDQTLVVVFLSSDPYVRRYELDLLRELKNQGLGMLRVAIDEQADLEVAPLVDHLVELRLGGTPMGDLSRAPAAVIFPQLLALFRSLHEGLLPDAPSPKGVINRVVQGVRIYPYSA